MNNLQPEERRAKADEIARLLEKEPLMVQDLAGMLKPHILVLLTGRGESSRGLAASFAAGSLIVPTRSEDY